MYVYVDVYTRARTHTHTHTTPVEMFCRSILERYRSTVDRYLIDIWCKYGVAMFQLARIVINTPDNLSV
jgi:hypothetical protein